MMPLLFDLRSVVVLVGLLHGAGAAVVAGCNEGTLQKATQISLGFAHSCAILVPPPPFPIIPPPLPLERINKISQSSRIAACSQVETAEGVPRRGRLRG